MSAEIPEGYVKIPMIDVKALAKEQRAKMKTEGNGDDVTLTLSKTEAQSVYRAADDIEYLLGITGTFLETLRLGISGGFLSGNDNGLNALLDLGARGLTHVTENEGRTLGKLGMRFRDLGLKYNEEA